MFKVYWTNHGYFSQNEFATLDDAIDYGKSKCFDFQVTAPDGVIAASWSVFGGLRLYHGYDTKRSK
jgi:hypothetical protein